jgi:hypothetical protein
VSGIRKLRRAIAPNLVAANVATCPHSRDHSNRFNVSACTKSSCAKAAFPCHNSFSDVADSTLLIPSMEEVVYARNFISIHTALYITPTFPLCLRGLCMPETWIKDKKTWLRTLNEIKSHSDFVKALPRRAFTKSIFGFN